MLENGWAFSDAQGCIPDSVNHAEFLYQIYQQADPDYSGRVTVPVLWDKQSGTIANNESSEIISMFNDAFDSTCECNAELDYFPVALRKEIGRVNEMVYKGFNNGVYRCGFATSQEAYEEAFHGLDRSAAGAKGIPGR